MGLKPKERIPLHDHRDFNSGGKIDGGTMSGTLGLSVGVAGGSTGGGTTITNPPIYKLVTDYGATGDGSTDDTSAIQDAIDDCAPYETLFLPTGDYKITSALSITSPIRLLGASAEPNWPDFFEPATSITQATADTRAIECTTFTSEVSIGWMTIRGPGGASSGAGIYTAVNVNLEAVGIHGFYDGLYIDDSLGGSGSSAYYNHIRNCWFTDNDRAGIFLHDQTNNTSIRESYFALDQQYGLKVDGGGYGLRVEDCSFELNTVAGMDIDGTGAGQSTSAVYIAGCYFEHFSSGSATATAADIRIGNSTKVYGALIEGCFFVQSDIATLWHVDVNKAQSVTLTGNFFGTTSEAGSVRGNATNASYMTLVNNYLGGAVSLPAGSRILDSTDVTPSSVGAANAAGTSFSLARADHAHAIGGTAGGDLSGTYPNPSVVNDSHTHTAATLPAISSDTDGLIPVTTTDSVTVDSGTPAGVTITSLWGIDGSGLPYYDTAGATAGEEAALFWDPATDRYVLIAYEF